ncbi:uncharacterized protein LOC129298700 [Prosopis cineraria]|uniref:uncharacterized protein LOC129298700 n=1 Tax=Prosopis cineraria TaxID=364024 RepID=UPI00240EEF4C|nr:uncharacterized protein LOC129298700 [Prosopis cineraria]
METETKAPVVAKKVWNIVRVVLVMLRKGIAKSKVALELHLLLKLGKLAGKAFANSTLMLHHHFASLSNNHRSFVPPRDYEFSCSNSPASYPFGSAIKRKHRLGNKSYQYDDVCTVAAVQKVLEMLNNESSMVVEASPPVTLPGFGKSPIGKQLRVTDSPFPLKDDGDSQVDLEAEEFIKKFYRDLNLQKTMAVLDSPCPRYLWDR